MRKATLVVASAIFWCALMWLTPAVAHAEEPSARVIAREAQSAADNPNQTDSTETETTDTVKITVKPGDTLSDIAAKYEVSLDDIVTWNQIDDPDVISVGQQIEISSTEIVEPEQFDDLVSAASSFVNPPVARASTATWRPLATTSTSTSTAPRASSAGNTYYWGQCTWYVKERKPYIPNSLGNAGSTWVSRMIAAGYSAGTAPRAGAIAVMTGHVAIVESVNADGTVNVSEMNWNGGVGVVNYRTTSASSFYSYIYA